jgi:hypothetical protein
MGTPPSPVLLSAVNPSASATTLADLPNPVVGHPIAVERSMMNSIHDTYDNDSLDCLIPRAYIFNQAVG